MFGEIYNPLKYIELFYFFALKNYNNIKGKLAVQYFRTKNINFFVKVFGINMRNLF